ncbi:MAG TPA: hypothetical protein ENN33_05815 [Ignavibacteria bacterium]|nr:hypothetical protein [Ignavibacteria bacterium]
MRDQDIRTILHFYLSELNKNIKDTIIVDELNVKNGLARVDIAVINGSIHGYEIKSEVDTLNRLTNQIEHYNSSLEKITIAVNSNHKQKVLGIVPKWWGIIEVDENSEIAELRESEVNPLLSISDLLLFLWKDEMINILEKNEVKYKKSSNRSALIDTMIQNIEKEKLLNEVRQALKSRKNWRS